MTSAEWEKSTDPTAMLAYLLTGRTVDASGTGFQAAYGMRLAVATDRRLRLFAVACCRSVWHLLTDDLCRKCIEAAERFADDPSAIILPFYDDAADRFEEMDRSGHDGLWQAAVVRNCCNPRDSFAQNVERSIVRALLRQNRVAPETLANICRDIFGNPHKPVELPVCQRCGGDCKMRWVDDPDTGICSGCIRGVGFLTPTVLLLAQAAYEGRAGSKCGECGGDGHTHPNRNLLTGDLVFTDWVCKACNGTGRIDDGALDPFRLALVADAIEEAGAGEEFTGHLHSPGPHVRGCAVLDAVLGKS
jgi:hypothetical protein